jgi:hypothetical protein
MMALAKCGGKADSVTRWRPHHHVIEQRWTAVVAALS